MLQISWLPVEFSYYPFSIENGEIGIIEIPLQERPIYLEQNFGKLEKGTVYIRRGSSTDTANLDEVARMGAELMRSNSVPQKLVFQWADLEKRIILPSAPTIYSLILDPPLPIRKEIPIAGQIFCDLPTRFLPCILEGVRKSGFWMPCY